MSINSSTDICNLSQDLLSAGIIDDVKNPSDATEEIYARWYDLTRKNLLRSHPWHFAAKRAVLAAESTDPAFGYDKQYPVPSDFMRILYLNDARYTTDVPTSGELYAFENGRILTSSYFTNDTTVKLVYVSDFTEVPRMDPMFIDLLAHQLALRVAYKMTETNTNIERLNAIQEQAGRLARAVNGQEAPIRRIERSRGRHARMYGSGREDRVIF